MAMCTPFDEASIPVIEEQKLDIIKVASCSFTDWPLLECIVKTDKPIIALLAPLSNDRATASLQIGIRISPSCIVLESILLLIRKCTFLK